MAAAARIKRETARHCGGVPGAPETQARKPWSAARMRRLTAEMSGWTAVQRSLAGPAFSPTSLVASPSKKLLIVPLSCPGGAEVAAVRAQFRSLAVPLDAEHGAEGEGLAVDAHRGTLVGDRAPVDDGALPWAQPTSRLVWKLEEAAIPISSTATPTWTM